MFSLFARFFRKKIDQHILNREKLYSIHDAYVVEKNILYSYTTIF